MKNKESAIPDFMDMIHSEAWTYMRMTASERDRLEDVMNLAVQLAVKGDYLSRWHILNAVYHAYLVGIGYDGFGWRDTEPGPF